MTDRRVDEYAARLPRWREEFASLRTILLDTELTEALKWRKPCYAHAGENIVIFQPFNDLCALMFFKGALLDDPEDVLREQGEASRSALRLEFRSVADVTRSERTLRELVADAIRVQQAGLRVERRPAAPRRLPGRIGGADGGRRCLSRRLRAADPGPPAWYLLHFNGAKQSATRTARIERVRDRIMDGFGIHD